MLDLYLKHKGLIISRAIKFARQFNLETEDVIAQGNLLFCICYKEYKAFNNAAFTTYFHSNLINLYRYCKNQSKLNLCEIGPVEFYPDQFDPFKEIEFEDFINSKITNETALILDCIINFNNEEGKITKQKIKKHFKKELGWSQLKTERLFNQIRLILNEWST